MLKQYLKAILRSMRPIQWTKNVFVFAGLIFSQEFLNPQKFLTSLSAFGAFCILSSGVYMLNDIADLPFDRLHPQKRKRPLPSGQLPLWLAWVSMVILIAVGLIWSYTLGRGMFLIALSYFILQLLYSVWLKHMVIVDILVIALGFLLRAAAGAVVLSVVISNWLILCTSLLALFMVTAKRRQELWRITSENQHLSRTVMKFYDINFLDQLLTIEAAATLTAYSLYVFSPTTIKNFGTPYLGFSLPFVIYGIFRYFYLVHIDGKGEEPEKLVLSDTPFIINLLLWVATVLTVIYIL